MDTVQLFASVSAFLLRHLYLYVTPGFVTLVGIAILAKAVRIDALITKLLPQLFRSDLLTLVGIGIASYALGIFLDQVVRSRLRRQFTYTKSVQSSFARSLQAALADTSISLRTILAAVATEDEIQQLRHGTIDKERFEAIFEDTMSELDVICQRNDRALFEAVTTPAELGMLFASNLALALLCLSLSLAAVGVPETIRVALRTPTVYLTENEPLATLAIAVVLLLTAYVLVKRSESFFQLRVQQAFSLARSLRQGTTSKPPQQRTALPARSAKKPRPKKRSPKPRVRSP